MFAYCVCVRVCVFPLKRVPKTKTKGITDTDLSQEKTQDQRKLVRISFSPPAEENAATVSGPLVSLAPLNPFFLFLSLTCIVFVGSWVGGRERRWKVGVGVGGRGGKKGMWINKTSVV